MNTARHAPNKSTGLRNYIIPQTERLVNAIFYAITEIGHKAFYEVSTTFDF